MPPFKPKPRQPSMSKAELRAQGVLALAQASKPVMKLPMKIKRQCARCDHFNSVLVEPGEAVPAFKCLAVERPRAGAATEGVFKRTVEPRRGCFISPCVERDLPAALAFRQACGASGLSHEPRHSECLLNA